MRGRDDIILYVRRTRRCGTTGRALARAGETCDGERTYSVYFSLRSVNTLALVPGSILLLAPGRLVWCGMQGCVYEACGRAI